MNLRLAFLESVIGDLFFYTSINLSNYSKSNYKFMLKNLINFIISSALVFRTMQLYSSIYSRLNAEEFKSLSEIEKEIAFDGLDENLLKSNLKK